MREEVGVLRPWGDLRPAAACVFGEVFSFLRVGLPRGILFGFAGGGFAAAVVGGGGWLRSAVGSGSTAFCYVRFAPARLDTRRRPSERFQPAGCHESWEVAFLGHWQSRLQHGRRWTGSWSEFGRPWPQRLFRLSRPPRPRYCGALLRQRGEWYWRPCPDDLGPFL